MSQNAYLEHAREMHRKYVVIDTHCDTTQRLRDPLWNFAARHDDGHVDLPRLREAGVDSVFLAVFAMGPLPADQGKKEATKQIRLLADLESRYPADIAVAATADDIRNTRDAGKIAVVIAIEGGYLIDDSLATLREFAASGAAYMTLTHGFHTTWADSAGIHEPLEPKHGGLTNFGHDVIREMNALGMMIDVSHVSDQAVWNVLETSRAPIIASHSSCRAVANHIRNLPDDLMRAIAQKGGIIQINFAAGFVDPHFPKLDVEMLNRRLKSLGSTTGPLTDHVTPLQVLVDHFEHALSVVGEDHVGIGTDFDGVRQLPEGMEDCSRLPHLTAELLRRGHAESSLKNMLGENVLRVMDHCRKASGQ